MKRRQEAAEEAERSRLAELAEAAERERQEEERRRGEAQAEKADTTDAPDAQGTHKHNIHIQVITLFTRETLHYAWCSKWRFKGYFIPFRLFILR